MLTARQYNCAYCHSLVHICSHCDRGNIYCAGSCAKLARKNALVLANKRYQNTIRGKFMHAKRQREYMQRKRAAIIKMTHHGSNQLPTEVSLEKTKVALEITNNIAVGAMIHCHFCGSLCPTLLRKDFLHTAIIKNRVVMTGYPCGP